jgi:hypothetical protein
VWPRTATTATTATTACTGPSSMQCMRASTLPRAGREGSEMHVARVSTGFCIRGCYRNPHLPGVEAEYTCYPITCLSGTPSLTGCHHNSCRNTEGLACVEANEKAFVTAGCWPKGNNRHPFILKYCGPI